MRVSVNLILIFGFLILGGDSLGLLSAWADETSAAAPETSSLAGSPPASDSTPATSSAKKKQKGRKPREKEAEGTHAPNRFEPDTFIKSRYELNGQSLEVDTE